MILLICRLPVWGLMEFLFWMTFYAYTTIVCSVYVLRSFVSLIINLIFRLSSSFNVYRIKSWHMVSFNIKFDINALCTNNVVCNMMLLLNAVYPTDYLHDDRSFWKYLFIMYMYVQIAICDYIYHISCFRFRKYMRLLTVYRNFSQHVDVGT